MSWCEADVFDLHGDVFPQTGMMSQLVDQEDCNVVYPDADPRGRLNEPQESPVIVPSSRPTISPGAPTIGAPAGAPPTLEEEIRQRSQPDSLPRPRTNATSPMQLPASVTEAPMNAVGYIPVSPQPGVPPLPTTSENVVPAQAFGAPPLPPVNAGGNR
jgi:hypothetical protein